MVTKYYTVWAMTGPALDIEVNKRLADDWELYGHPYAVGDELVCQAMVKRYAPVGGIGPGR